MSNILHVITKLELGGAQKSTLYLLNEMVKRYGASDNIFLFTSRGVLNPADYKIENFGVVYSENLVRNINPFKDLIAFFEIVKFIKKKNIDVVHTHSSKAGIIGRFAAKVCNVRKVVHTVHGFSFNQYQPVLRNVLYLCSEKIASSLTDCFIFVCESDVEKAKKHGLLKGRTRSILVRENFTEFEQKFYDVCSKTDVEDNKKTICMIACLKPQKSVLDFVRTADLVLKKRGDVIFELVGDGELKRKVEMLSRELKIENSFRIYGWQKFPASYLQKCYIFVLSSKWEGLPIVLYEAMYFAKPIVATNVDGVKEVVSSGENGFLVKPGDCNSMAEKIIYILENPDIYEKMSAASKEKLKKFTGLNEMVCAINKIYRD